MKDQNTDIIKKKIKYFGDYWDDLTRADNSIEHQLMHAILYDPKEFFKEFLHEIKLNKLSKSRNKKLFFDKTKQFSKLDLDFLKPALTLIQQQFSEKNYDYLSHLIDRILIDLSDFKLGNEVIDKLIIILTDNSDMDKKKIKDFTNLILVEFSYKKYSKKTISKIIYNIFSDYKEIGNIIYCDFPHNITIKDHFSSEYTTFKNKLKTYIDNLTTKDRLLALKNYLNKKPKKLRYIFQIQGLVGDDANIKIGSVQIYNPKTTKLIKKQNNNSAYINEMFGVNNDYNPICCNGAVEVDVIDPEYAKQEALQILDKVTDVVVSLYLYYNTPIVINKFQYLVITNKGENIGRGTGNNPLIPSIEIENKKYNEVVKFYSNKILQKNIPLIDRNIVNSIYWKRKAIEVVDDNQKILFHWIALENILSNTDNIFRIVPKLLAKVELYGFAWTHFKILKNLIGETPFFPKIVNLPQQLIISIGLNTNTIHIKKFINQIDKINKHIDKNSLFYDELNYLKSIFTDTDKCIELLDSFEKNISEKLIYVYRIRNKIAHNAYNEVTPLIATYANFISEVSSASISAFEGKRDKLQLDTTDKIVNDLIYEYEKFKMRLKEKGANILLGD